MHSGVGYAAPCVVPEQADLTRAAEVLNAGKKVAILAEAGALEAGKELVQVANLLGAGVAKALPGKAALPDDPPMVTGQTGLLGTEPPDWMMRHCDTLLMVGSRFPYSTAAKFCYPDRVAVGFVGDRAMQMPPSPMRSAMPVKCGCANNRPHWTRLWRRMVWVTSADRPELRRIHGKRGGTMAAQSGSHKVIYVALAGGDTNTGAWEEAALLFAQEAMGGVILGLTLGWLTFRLMRLIDDCSLKILLTLGLVFGGYELAVGLQVSALIGRLAAVMIPLLILKRFRSYRWDVVPIMVWGGLRGGISIALGCVTSRI